MMRMMMMMCIINTVYEDEHKRYYNHQVRMWVALFALCVAPTNSNRTEGEGAVSQWHRHNHCCGHSHYLHSIWVPNTYQWREHLPVLSKNSRALPIFHLCPQLERLRPVSWFCLRLSHQQYYYSDRYLAIKPLWKLQRRQIIIANIIILLCIL